MFCLSSCRVIFTGYGFAIGGAGWAYSEPAQDLIDEAFKLDSVTNYIMDNLP